MLLGLLALGAASLLSPEPGAGKDDGWKSLPPRAALAAAPCLEPASADLGKVRLTELAAARAGSFAVFGGEPTRLRPPIDWTEDLLGAHRYRQNLHKLRYLRPLLASYRDSGNGGDLTRAFAIALDWVEQNPRGDAGTPSEAWGDKISGDRVPFLSYLLRAAACEGVGSWEERRTVLAALEDHGRVLASDRRYTPTNHGLFVDLGLVRLARLLPFSPDAAGWRQLGRERFVMTLTRRLSDGYWLEHSTGYQFLAIRALERLLAEFSDDPELERLLAEMRDAAGWMVRPDGEVTQFGESHKEAVPEWVDTSPRGPRFASGAGFAFVRADGDDGAPGYLAVTSGFHNLTHKQADELSFELFDGGEEIVTDTGSYDKDPGPIRDFVVSNRAHSTLVADGLDLPLDQNELAYGSGLTAAGAGDGWYAISFRRLIPRNVVELSSPGEGGETFVVTIAIDRATPTVDEVSHSPGTTTVTFDDRSAVTAERDGETLSVAG
jgi:hypothetical protein